VTLQATFDQQYPQYDKTRKNSLTWTQKLSVISLI